MFQPHPFLFRLSSFSAPFLQPCPSLRWEKRRRKSLSTILLGLAWLLGRGEWDFKNRSSSASSAREIGQKKTLTCTYVHAYVVEWVYVTNCNCECIFFFLQSQGGFSTSLLTLPAFPFPEWNLRNKSFFVPFIKSDLRAAFIFLSIRFPIRWLDPNLPNSYLYVASKKVRTHSPQYKPSALLDLFKLQAAQAGSCRQAGSTRRS